MSILYVLRNSWRLGAKALGIITLLACVAVLSSAQSGVTINQYPLSKSQMNPWGITAGPDGAIWFTESCPSFYCGGATNDAIGRITSSGVITEYPLPVGASPYGIVTGPDGALWFTELNANKIGRMTTSGVVTEYPLLTSNANAYKITTGADGALWFTEMSAGKIGRITTDGIVSEYSVRAVCCTDPTDIVTGPDGALWFTNLNSNWIGRMTTQGNVTEYALPIPSGDYGIAAGPDNALWIAGGNQAGAVVWRLTTDGTFSMYSVPSKDAGLVYIALGHDNALWFTEEYGGRIGRVTTSGVFTEYTVGGYIETGPVAIAAGPGGDVWFGKLGFIGRILPSDTSAPIIKARSNPQVLWPPNKKMVAVTVSGSITDDDSGVFAGSAEYTVTDEYQMVQPRGHIALDQAGKFSFTLWLSASREGADKDGRRYRILVSARDNVGNLGVNWTVVNVPHQR